MFKRQVSVGLLITLFLLGLYGCSERGRYYSKDGGFSIRFPDGWKIEKMKPVKKETEVLVIASWSRLNIGVTIENLSKPLGSKEFFEIVIGNKSKSTGYQEYERGEARLDNNAAYWVINAYGSEPHKVISMDYMLAKDHRGYIISCGGNPDQFSKYKDKMKGVVQSFKFE